MAYKQAVSHQCEKSALIISGKSLNYAEQDPSTPPPQAGIHDGSASAEQAAERGGEVREGRELLFCLLP